MGIALHVDSLEFNLSMEIILLFLPDSDFS